MFFITTFFVSMLFTNQSHIMAETRLSVRVYYRQYQTVQFWSYAWKCLDVGWIYSYTTVSSRQKER